MIARLRWLKPLQQTRFATTCSTAPCQTPGRFYGDVNAASPVYAVVDDAVFDSAINVPAALPCTLCSTLLFDLTAAGCYGGGVLCWFGLQQSCGKAAHQVSLSPAVYILMAYPHGGAVFCGTCAHPQYMFTLLFWRGWQLLAFSRCRLVS